MIARPNSRKQKISSLQLVWASDYAVSINNKTSAHPACEQLVVYTLAGPPAPHESL